MYGCFTGCRAALVVGVLAESVIIAFIKLVHDQRFALENQVGDFMFFLVLGSLGEAAYVLLRRQRHRWL